MNRPDDLYRELGDWLSDGPTEVADRVIEGALDAIQRTRQRRRQRVPWRFPAMPFAHRLALVAMLIVATVGTTLVVSTGLSPSPAGLRTIVVAQDGSGDFTTITDAVTVAQDGDTVLVKPGTYLESVVITEDITLRGDGDAKAVVLEFAASPNYSLNGEPFAVGILLDGSGAHVANLTVRGPADDGSDPAIAAFLIAGGAPVIDTIAIVLYGDRWDYGDGSYYRRSAFQVIGGSGVTVSDSSWDGYARMSGLSNSPIFERNVVTGQHIAVAEGGQEPTIRGNTFLDGAAIRWDAFGSGGLAEDNDITGWIGVDDRNDPTIRNNRIRQPAIPDPSSGDLGAAIQIASGATPLVEGNAITDSPYGIEVSGFGAQPMISRNTISGSISAAILVAGGAAPIIDGNVIERNATGIEVIGRASPILTGNTLCDNGTDLVVPEGSTLTLDGNTICTEASAAP